MRRETLIAWRGKNEVEEELKEKAGEKGSKAARQQGTQVSRQPGVQRSDITGLCNIQLYSRGTQNMHYLILPLLPLSVHGYSYVAVLLRSISTNTSYPVQSPTP